MTDEQILEVASQYLHYDVDGDRADEWRGEHYELLKFARKIFEEGQQEEIRRQKTGIGYVNGVLTLDEF